MARTPYWLSNFAKLYLQYFCASLASIPAGLLAFGLIKSGLSEFISLAVAIIFGLFGAAIIWRILDRRLPLIQQERIQPGGESFGFSWQFQNIGSGACLAGTMVIVTTVTHPGSVAEYKSFEMSCRTGTATSMQLSSRKE